VLGIYLDVLGIGVMLKECLFIEDKIIFLTIQIKTGLLQNNIINVII